MYEAYLGSAVGAMAVFAVVLGAVTWIARGR